jgi:hypothetical protein
MVAFVDYRSDQHSPGHSQWLGIQRGWLGWVNPAVMVWNFGMEKNKVNDKETLKQVT